MRTRTLPEIEFPSAHRGFAIAAQQRVNGALLRCEERFPSTGHHSVLYVVVERNAAQVQQDLSALHREYFGPEEEDPLAPVRLEVVDRATDAALQRLVDAGLIAETTRATRELWPSELIEAGMPALSAAALQKMAAHRQHGKRRLKMARVLTEAGLAEEARQPLLEAILAVGRSLAVGHRLPEPEVVTESLLPPFAAAWKSALPVLRRFAAEPTEPSEPALRALGQFVDAG